MRKGGWGESTKLIISVEAYSQAQFTTSAALLATDFLYDLYSGDHDDKIEELARSNGSDGSKIEWLGEGNKMVPLRDLNRILNLYKNVVGTSTGDPPPCTRALKRMSSEADGDDAAQHELMRERASVWKQVSEKRQKRPCQIIVSAATRGTKRAYQEAFELSPVYKFTGAIGSRHRLFSFSAELKDEATAGPWAQPFDPGSSADEMLAFITEQQWPFDAFICGDGRSTKARRTIEDAVADSRHLSELWVVYKPTSARVGKRVFLGSDNKETLHVSMPVPRTQLQVKKRLGNKAPTDNACGAGEKSTYSSTYTGARFFFLPAEWRHSLLLVPRAGFRVGVGAGVRSICVLIDEETIARRFPDALGRSAHHLCCRQGENFGRFRERC